MGRGRAPAPTTRMLVEKGKTVVVTVLVHVFVSVTERTDLTEDGPILAHRPRYFSLK